MIRRRRIPDLVLLISLCLQPACLSGRTTAPTRAAQYPSPMVERARSHERISAPDALVADTIRNGRFPGEILVQWASDGLDTRSSTWLIHFHGPAHIPFSAVSVLGRLTTAIVVNFGSGSSVYERPFDAPGSLARFVETVADQSSDEALPDTLFLSAFSAGYGAVRAILRQDTVRIAGILLLDGLHSDYVPEGRRLHDGGRIDERDLAPFLNFARRASSGERTMVYTHSSVFPGTYASTTETADYILDELALLRTPVLEWGPAGMQLLSRAERGRLHILGFAGNTAPDHVDHLHGMPEFLKLLLDE